MSAPMAELEFKFELAADFNPAVLQKWLTADTPGDFLGVQQYQDLYYDTLSRDLWQAGLACRRRIVNQTEKLEIKLQPKKAGALFCSRYEWSLKTSSPQRRFSEKSFRRFIQKELEFPVTDKLELIAIINSERSKWQITFKECRCELSSDTVTASIPGMPGEQLRFGELELELLNPGKAAESDFVILGKALQDRFHLNASETSKLERTLSFFGCNPSLNPKPSYQPDEPTVQIIPPILKHYFRIMLGNEGGTRLGLDNEALHDMRVAIRKLRTALTVFGPGIPRTGFWRIRRNLKWIADLLGAVRDCDVLHEWLSSDREYHPLLPVLEELRTKRRERLIFQFSQRRYCEFTKTILPRFFQQSFTTRLNQRFTARPAAKFAAATLARRFKNTERCTKQVLKNFATVSDQELHELRIRFKKLRYSLEYFAPLYDPRQLRELNRQLQDIQDKLGAFVDTLFIPAILNELQHIVSRKKKLKITAVPPILTLLNERFSTEREARKNEVLMVLNGLITNGVLLSRLKTPDEIKTRK